MDPKAEPLTMYGAPSEVGGLDWATVREQLETAGGYWVVASRGGRPHPRPVWGIWHDAQLHLSVGSPTIRADLAPGALLTVHLGSINDVVILDGAVLGETEDRDLLDRYDAKYDWNYTVDEYGPLTTVAPAKIMAWRSDGWAGRDGFGAASRWVFEPGG